MANGRRNSNGVKKPGLSRSPQHAPHFGRSFSLRMKDEPKEYSDHQEMRSSPSRDSNDMRSNGSSDRSEHSPRERHDNEHKDRKSSTGRAPKARRRNSCDVIISSGSTAKARRRNSCDDFRPSARKGWNDSFSSCDQSYPEEYPISFGSSERSDPVSSERSDLVSNRSSESSDKKESRPLPPHPREEYSNERKISKPFPTKARRRNSCEVFTSSSGSAAKARRRNSCDAFTPSKENHSNETYSEEYNPINYLSSDQSNDEEYFRSSDMSNPEEYPKNYKSIECGKSRSRSNTRSHRSNDHSEHGKRRASAKGTRRNSCENEHKSRRSSASGAKGTRRNSCDNEIKSSKPSGDGVTKTARRNSCENQHNEFNTPVEITSSNIYANEQKSSRPSIVSSTKASRRNSCEYVPKSSTASPYSAENLARSNSWNGCYADRKQEKMRVSTKQKQPRRLKSYPNPATKKLSLKKSHSKSKNIKSSTGTKKKKSNSNRKLSSQDTNQNAPKSFRLNSQLMSKVGDFRPYFVPLKKKQEVLSSRSVHQESQISQTFIAGTDHSVNEGPAQILHEGMKKISVASFLHDGIPVVKVSHNKFGKLRRRVLTLSEDQTTLFLTHSKLAKGTRNSIPKQPAWTPSKGWNGTYIRAVDVANICDFQVGVVSSRWLELSISTYAKKARKNSGENSSAGNNDKKLILPYMPDPARVASTVTIFFIDPISGRTDSLDFFIENQDHRRAVVATLALMRHTYAEASQLVGNEILLFRYILKDMNLGTNDKGDLAMTEFEFMSFCRRLNFSAESIGKEFRQYYENGSSGKNKNKLPVNECLQLIKLMKGKENPSLAAWRACFGPATCVDTLTVLTKFLHGPQQEQQSCGIQDARDLINVMNATEIGEVLSNRKGSLLTQWQFEEFLRSEWNDIYDPEKRVIDKERLLDKPLSHYWINSSFRTSSMKDGMASVHSYSMALLRGCKSIDINCWDGMVLPNGDCVPIIIPFSEDPGTSFSLKNKLTFRSVVLVVRKYLRENRNTYPIMFNLENNCSPPFQKKMVKIMKEVFGKHLFVPTSVDRQKELPSPEDLRGMIVVNARRASKRNKYGTDSNRSKNQTDDAYSKMFNKFNPIKADSESGKPHSFSSQSSSDSELVNELSSLTLFHDASFSGYFVESMDLICSHMHGFEDTDVPKIAKEYSDNPKFWRKFNENHLTRIYPGSDEMDSSLNITNFNPVFAWGMGCQMTALNFQTHDNDLAINDGFFRQTGGLGYLEKPHWLMGTGERPKPTVIKIRVLSGSCIPKPFVGDKDGSIDDAAVSNPRVVLELHDVIVRGDQAERFKISKHKIDCGNKNGFCPVFMDKGRKFSVDTPDVAMLVFRVEQKTNKRQMISTTAVPVSCLRKGYRSIQLYDADNTRLGRFASATLLVFIM